MPTKAAVEAKPFWKSPFLLLAGCFGYSLPLFDAKTLPGSSWREDMGASASGSVDNVYYAWGNDWLPNATVSTTSCSHPEQSNGTESDIYNIFDSLQPHHQLASILDEKNSSEGVL